MKNQYQKNLIVRLPFSVFFLLFSLVITAACQNESHFDLDGSPTYSPTTQPINFTVEPHLADIYNLWENSPHANTYGIEKGPNTYCARCHSPQNWDPQAEIGPPPNCVTCKFPSDPEVRVSQSNAFVPEEEWKTIDCEVCHYRSQDGLEKNISWLNMQTGYHETVHNATQLCEKCHTDTETLKHERDLGSKAHKDFTCTSCHDPHSTEASCTSLDCHPQIVESSPIPGHDEKHLGVNCVACHDALKLEVGPLSDGNTWTTLRTTELLGRPNTQPYQSHNLQKQVDCVRCHYPYNPWELSSLNTP